ncbi:hypothetical protein O6H91_01G101200 [Diphasiastrum complanatum]|uniref:Uncharacterized protein n=1 Tax=Diphasiastrum complanatum TaxID=34168 RepID=A0ACC2EU29_DIPCM|nr:hypothetical protein O6H91_01G101200 [Diphasiastrum complanatum]
MTTRQLSLLVQRYFLRVATLLQSATETFYYGISGAFWITSTSAIQLFLFGIVAMEIKRRAPKAHTVIELVRIRWGHAASIIFFYLCYLNNAIVCTLSLIGAGNVLVAATGMNIYAALMLLSVSVVVYTVTGGLKATFISSYLHTIVIFVTLNVFAFKVFASNTKPIGSMSKVWDNLQKYAAAVPVQGNKDGSYLTLLSKGGVEFGILNAVASFGNLWTDQAYWQSAIAATPKAAMQGYILGGLLWFPIPFAISISLGLCALALDLPLSEYEINQGLVPVAASQFLFGKGGVLLLVTIVYMAVTSTVSAEFIAMSSLFTYDIYKAYIRPKSTGNELLVVSRACVFITGIAMGGFSCFIFKVKISVNFLFLVMGTLVSSGVPPLTFMLTWPAVSANAAIASAILGQIGGIIAWLVHTKVVYHRLSISDTLQKLGPTLDGCLVSLILSAIVCVIWSTIFPDTTDGSTRFQEIELMDEVKVADPNTRESQKPTHFITILAIILTVMVIIVWPVLTLPARVFSKNYFIFWVVLTISWTMVATIVCILLPWVESKSLVLTVLKRMFHLICNKML